MQYSLFCEYYANFCIKTLDITKKSCIMIEKEKISYFKGEYFVLR